MCSITKKGEKGVSDPDDTHHTVLQPKKFFMRLVGEIPEGSDVIIVDDICDTASRWALLAFPPSLPPSFLSHSSFHLSIQHHHGCKHR